MKSIVLSTAILAVLGLTATIAAETDSAPMVSVSFYAPLQDTPPVRIVGFRHDQKEALLLLLNRSDKPVAAVFVGRVDLVPSGCGIERMVEGIETKRSYSTVGYEVSIAPHGNAVAAKYGIPAMSTLPSSAPDYPHFPEVAFESARQRGVACMQVQFGITAVFFEDGTAWPAELDHFLRDFNALHPSLGDKEKLARLDHPDPFDPTLAEAEAKEHRDVSAVADALQEVKEVVFDRESPQASGDEKYQPPRLRFSCSLEGPKAICRMPLENDSTARQAQPTAGGQE